MTAFITLLVLVLIGAGGTIASESALPGEALYTIKTQINERIVSGFRLTASSRARHAVTLLEKRLEETEQLALEGGLDAEVSLKAKEAFTAQVERVRERIKALLASGDVETSADVSSDATARLAVGEAVLEAIADKKTEMRAQIQSFLTEIRATREEFAKMRFEAETETTVKSNPDVRVAAENAIATAEKKISEVQKFLAGASLRVGADVKAAAEAQLEIAARALASSKASLEAEAFASAFRAAKDAHHAAQEVKVLLGAAWEVGVDFGIGTRFLQRVRLRIDEPGMSPEDEQTDERSEQERDMNARGRASTETDVSSAGAKMGTETRTEGEVNIDL